MFDGRDEIRLRRWRGPRAACPDTAKQAIARPPKGPCPDHAITATLDSMKKKLLHLFHVSIAVALCANGLAAPAAADELPTATGTPRVRPLPGAFLRVFTTSDAVDDRAAAITTTAKASNDSPADGAVWSAAPTETASRVAPVARSYPRTFHTYDALLEHANELAAAQNASNDRLAQVMAREDATRAALEEIFNPRVRGGLLKTPTDVVDAAVLKLLRTQLANDSATRRQLIADGAVVAPAPSSWHVPLVGENTQDFGSTPYWFEPALTYQGVYYEHFHSGTDIAAPWGTPIVAPAWGVVTFAGTMGDGAEVVVIAHDGGVVSMYAHLDNHIFPVPVKAGDAVHAGDRIGNVGLTGITTGAHLHWSAWRNSEPIDPLSMIRSE
jgi:murein DD-endopeptidase MepM/ murein hydrolase activator NlpD